MKPGERFVAAHASFPQEGSRSPWLARYEAFAVASGADRDQAAKARVAVETHLHLLAPEADAVVLQASSGTSNSSSPPSRGAAGSGVPDRQALG
ncbi:MAG: hypothetical protein COT28_04645 [Methylobacterium sp. CG08_land_8_20_14_0_20_71_15]|nr:hypothetical protein AX289_24125 [Methylorubrum populi]PIU04869.1 MAG: hypothetical protein COT56_17795 [Methylobacterium sp. CG09_land_8_20_14_0_10_71_15]PIU15352.1 MAG: hypothetical protein COT28_04645 [Methylobacterium sp. CG08_land_8_20_14_0_20_71_15]